MNIYKYKIYLIPLFIVFTSCASTPERIENVSVKKYFRMSVTASPNPVTPKAPICRIKITYVIEDMSLYNMCADKNFKIRLGHTLLISDNKGKIIKKTDMGCTLNGIGFDDPDIVEVKYYKNKIDILFAFDFKLISEFKSDNNRSDGEYRYMVYAQLILSKGGKKTLFAADVATGTIVTKMGREKKEEKLTLPFD